MKIIPEELRVVDNTERKFGLASLKIALQFIERNTQAFPGAHEFSIDTVSDQTVLTVKKKGATMIQTKKKKANFLSKKRTNVSLPASVKRLDGSDIPAKDIEIVELDTPNFVGKGVILKDAAGMKADVNCAPGQQLLADKKRRLAACVDPTDLK